MHSSFGGQPGANIDLSAIPAPLERNAATKAPLSRRPFLSSPAWLDGQRASGGYRPDIEGLRAVAVWPVVLFHADVRLFSGGFVGVDVFFVISGYLITLLLLADLARGTISLADFYERRIRRIFPALFVMLAVCAVAATAWMFPGDLIKFGSNLAASALSASNIVLFYKSDYFAGAAKLNPLLHTWSLGVEEQFYLLWPLVLLVLGRWRPRWLVPVTGAIVVTSLAACIWMTPRDHAATFYLLPYRAWEFLLGAILAMRVLPAFTRRQTAQAAVAAGLFMIAFAVVTFSEATVFPGTAVILPCLGTALVIHAGERAGSGGIVGLLANPVMSFFGKISYSFYLWHWPLFAFVRYRMIEAPSQALLLLVVVPLTIICATLSWQFVEKPFRRKRLLGDRLALFQAAGALVACTVLTAGVAMVSKGLPLRFPAQVNRIAGYAQHERPYASCGTNPRLDSDCIIGNPDKLRVMLWGDSHAAALAGAMERVARTGASTLFAAQPSCPPLLDMGDDDRCIRANKRRLDLVLGNPRLDTVILASRWSYYYKGRALSAGPAETNGDLPELQDAEGRHYPQFTPAARNALERGLTRLVGRLTAAGKNVILVYPVPETGHNIPFTLARMANRGVTTPQFSIPKEAYLKRSGETLAMLDRLGTHPRLTRIYPGAVLCPENDCVASLDGVPLYFDSAHLNAVGAGLLAPQIEMALGPK